MNILIFFPYNARTVEQQSVMELLVRQGHGVVLLTTCERGWLHNYVEGLGVKAEATVSTPGKGKLAYYRNLLRTLRATIKKYGVELVIAHQQEPALVAGLLKKLHPFHLVYVRHNTDEDYKLNEKKAKLFNTVVNKLTPVKVAPSAMVERFWISREGVKPDSIRRINYGYNFGQYEGPDPQASEAIRREFPAALRILSISRLVEAKRHKQMFAVVKRLVESGIDCRLICLGGGPLEAELKQLIAAMDMEQHISLLGIRKNVFDYIAAADVFMHLSYTEASNSAVKEVGLCRKPVIVCRGVGDFDDYIRHGKNGFLLDKEDPAEEAFATLRELAAEPERREAIGSALGQDVLDTFEISRVAEKYRTLIAGFSKPGTGREEGVHHV